MSRDVDAAATMRRIEDTMSRRRRAVYTPKIASRDTLRAAVKESVISRQAQPHVI